MTAIRDFVKVKEHKIQYTLPKDFNYSEVEIIILPKESSKEWSFWSDDEIENFGKTSFGLSKNDYDDEDYSKW